MSAQANKEFIRNYLEEVSGKPKPEELLRKYITDEHLIEHIMVSEAAFPLYSLDVEETIAEGDLVSIRGFFSGTHLGPFMGVPATDKPFRSPLFVTYRIAAGKIVEHWMMIDEADLMHQLGITQTQVQGS
jgi:predicted ester cyclase